MDGTGAQEWDSSRLLAALILRGDPGFPLSQVRNVLELGAGSGALALRVAPSFPSLRKYLATDVEGRQRPMQRRYIRTSSATVGEPLRAR